MNISGPRRLAVFVSVTWVIIWWFLFFLDPLFNAGGFFLFGIAPVGAAWGVAWVAAGFRRRTAAASRVDAPASRMVRARLKQSADVHLWVHSRLDGLKIATLPHDKRTQLASACWHVAVEHAQAIVLLGHAELYGSARALIRPLLEAYVRGLWLRLAATDDQVDDAGQDRFPNDFGRLIADVEGTGTVPAGGLGVLKANWKRLCSLTHTGYQQLGARLTSEGLGYDYTDSEIVEALVWADWIALMAVVAFATVAENEHLRVAALKRIGELP